MRKTGKRQINLEILRIISMLMIITLHFLGHGKVLSNVEANSSFYYLTWSIEGICYIAVNCYVLISGYFLVNSTFRIEKLITLLVQVIFYSAFIYILFCVSGYTNFTLLEFLKAITPTISGEYWFVTMYVGMYVLSPFINVLIKNMNQKQHMSCILLLIFLFSILPSIVYYSAGLNFGGGTGVVWFIVLYMIAAYIKKYYVPEYKVSTYLLRYLIFAILVPACKFLLEYCANILGESIGNTEFLYSLSNKVYQYNSIVVLGASVMFFLLFLNIRNENLSEKVLHISSLCFGVYLIHDNRYIRPVLWELINPPQYIGRWSFMFYMSGSIVLIFIYCILVEYIRKKLWGFISLHIPFRSLEMRIKEKTEMLLTRLIS